VDDKPTGAVAEEESNSVIDWYLSQPEAITKANGTVAMPTGLDLTRFKTLGDAGKLDPHLELIDFKWEAGGPPEKEGEFPLNRILWVFRRTGELSVPPDAFLRLVLLGQVDKSHEVIIPLVPGRKHSIEKHLTITPQDWVVNEYYLVEGTQHAPVLPYRFTTGIVPVSENRGDGRTFERFSLNVKLGWHVGETE
jgi:hypothetical protein